MSLKERLGDMFERAVLPPEDRKSIRREREKKLPQKVVAESAENLMQSFEDFLSTTHPDHVITQTIQPDDNPFISDPVELRYYGVEGEGDWRWRVEYKGEGKKRTLDMSRQHLHGSSTENIALRTQEKYMFSYVVFLKTVHESDGTTTNSPIQNGNLISIEKAEEMIHDYVREHQ